MSNRNPWEYTRLDYPGQLAYLTVACTSRCNFACPYCSKRGAAAQELDFPLLRRLFAEALPLGLKKVELTGGEALLHPAFWEVVDFLRGREVTVQLVSNGALIDREVAERLAERQVNVALSLSTLDAKRFRELSGGKGELATVLAALDHLLKAGCSAAAAPYVAIHALGSREVFPELAALRAFARERGCGFVLNRAIPTGGLQADNLPPLEALREFLDAECGSAATIPFSGDTPCNRLQAGCYIGADALVRPCASIDRSVGDLRRQSIAGIWRDSELLTLCRDLHGRLEGSCGCCPQRQRCYGCRAVAFAAFGSLTAPDPGCFRFAADGNANSDIHQGGLDR